MTEQRERQVAYKTDINSLKKGNYVTQEGWDPNYIQIDDKKISRANIIAAVVDKQVTDNLATITIDDGTGNIVVKAFNEEVKKLENTHIGDVVLLIGRPRVYNNELFVSLEIIRKVDSLWAKVRKLELGKDSKKEIEIPTKQESKREKILNIVRAMDNSEGVDLSEVLKRANIEDGESIVDELLKEGELYENKPGRLRSLI